VHAEDLLVDERGYGEAVEAVGESLPDLDVVSALACTLGIGGTKHYSVSRRS
jgi:hypothetical protein